MRLIEDKLDVASADIPREESSIMNPVDLQLDFVLGSMPKKVRERTNLKISFILSLWFRRLVFLFGS